MRLFLAMGAMLSALFILNGCAKSALEHYDACAAQTSTFVAMVECGKQARLTDCQAALNTCSNSGTALMQYADSLVMSVKNKEMSEAEALRRFAEYKTGVITNIQRDRAIRSTRE